MRRSQTISLPEGQYHSLRKQRISLIESRKERASRILLPCCSLFGFLLPVSHLLNKCIGLCPKPYLVFSDKDITQPPFGIFYLSLNSLSLSRFISFELIQRIGRLIIVIIPIDRSARSQATAGAATAPTKINKQKAIIKTATATLL